MRCFPLPERISSVRASSSCGQSTGHCRSSSVTPAASSIPRTTSVCSFAPIWLAAASATCGPRSGTPDCMAATAWNGFRDERGKTGVVMSPRAVTTDPSPESTTAEPTWRDSMKPLRSRTASSTASEAAKVADILPVYGSPDEGPGRGKTQTKCPLPRLDPTRCCSGKCVRLFPTLPLILTWAAVFGFRRRRHELRSTVAEREADGTGSEAGER